MGIVDVPDKNDRLQCTTDLRVSTQVKMSLH